MKYFIKLEGHEFKILLFFQILIIVMLIANCFKPIFLYVDDEILKELYHGEIQIEKNRENGEIGESNSIKKNKTENQKNKNNR